MTEIPSGPLMIRLKGQEIYVSDNLSLVERKDAGMHKFEDAQRLAKRMFPDGTVQIEFVPATYSEFNKYIGKIGGHTVTPKKLRHLRTKPKKQRQKLRDVNRELRAELQKL